MTGDNASDGEVMFKLSDLEVSSKMGAVPEARVELDVQGEQVEMMAQGDGPVDAALKALRKLPSPAPRSSSTTSMPLMPAPRVRARSLCVSSARVGLLMVLAQTPIS